jgi:alpha-glucosidase (family GH31 glycosyl hydrolase)
MQNGGGVTRPQLFTRVIQFGAWSPVFTAYGNGGSNDNLWEMPKQYQGAMQRSLAHRAALLPYSYSGAQTAHKTGLATIRPMYYECVSSKARLQLRPSSSRPRD